MYYNDKQQPHGRCAASLNDCYSRKAYTPCKKPAVMAVTLYGIGLTSHDKVTEMCADCWQRTHARWSNAVAYSMQEVRE